MMFVSIMIFLIAPIFIGLVIFCYGCWKLHKLEKAFQERWDEGEEWDDIDEAFQEFYEECRRNNINLKE